jgi:hypothetical protein
MTSGTCRGYAIDHIARVTMRDRPVKRFAAYMLDLGQYTGQRKGQGLDMISFWKHEGKESLRRT